MASKTSVTFLTRLAKDVVSLYSEEHWSDSNLENNIEEVKKKLNGCIELYSNGYVTEAECVRMIYWQYTKKKKEENDEAESYA